MKIFIFLGLSIVAYIAFMQIIFKLLFKVKQSITTKFILKLITYVGVFIIILGYLNHYDLTKNVGKTLFQSSAVIVAILTFSAQKFLGNVISGIALTFQKPFELGEKVQLKSTGGNIVVEGYIIDITIRHTSIKQVDGKVCLVPNSVIDELVVVNSNTLENMGYPFYMFCSFDSDVELAIELMQEEIDKNKRTIKTDEVTNRVLCSEVADDGFKLQAIIWTDNITDNFKACSELRISIFKAWQEHGIDIPYKTITIKE